MFYFSLFVLIYLPVEGFREFCQVFGRVGGGEYDGSEKANVYQKHQLSAKRLFSPRLPLKPEAWSEFDSQNSRKKLGIAADSEGRVRRIPEAHCWPP